MAKKKTTKEYINECIQLGYDLPIEEYKGEKFIQNWLDKNNIKYEPQKKFNDLKDKLSLSYDFYLPEQKVLIEYQGA